MPNQFWKRLIHRLQPPPAPPLPPPHSRPHPHSSGLPFQAPAAVRCLDDREDHFQPSSLRPWSLRRYQGLLQGFRNDSREARRPLLALFRGPDSVPLSLRLHGQRVISRLRDPTHSGRLRAFLGSARAHRQKWRRSSTLFLRAPNKAANLAEQVTSYYNEMNVARDIIICRAADGSLHTTEFCVRFKPTSRVLKWLVGSPTKPASATTDSGEEGVVDILVNGSPAPLMRMVLDNKGEGTFIATGTRYPSKDALASLPLLNGKNMIRFLHRGPYGDVSVDASCFVWGSEDRLIVSDIDGTITKSNILGYLDTVQLGKYDYVHHGICQLYSQISTHGVHFVYLTARPVALLDSTRQFLAGRYYGCRQNGYSLPPGPIFACPEGYVSVLYRELVDKSIKYFKAYALEDISMVFHKAGRRPDHSLFLGGFGNAVTDGVAYLAAGIHPDFIFIINPYSDIRIYGCGNQGLGAGKGEYKELEEAGLPDPSSPVFLSYSDSRLWIFLRSRLGLGPGEKMEGEGEEGGETRGVEARRAEDVKSGEELGPQAKGEPDKAVPAT